MELVFEKRAMLIIKIVKRQKVRAIEISIYETIRMHGLV